VTYGRMLVLVLFPVLVIIPRLEMEVLFLWAMRRMDYSPFFAYAAAMWYVGEGRRDQDRDAGRLGAIDGRLDGSYQGCQ